MSRPTRKEVAEDISLNRVMAPGGWKRNTLWRYARAYLELLEENERLETECSKIPWTKQQLKERIIEMEKENTKLRKVVGYFRESHYCEYTEGGKGPCGGCEALRELDEQKP